MVATINRRIISNPRRTSRHGVYGRVTDLVSGLVFGRRGVSGSRPRRNLYTDDRATHHDAFKKDILRKFVQDDGLRYRILKYGIVMTDTPNLDAARTVREMLRSALGGDDKPLENVRIVVVEHDAERHQQQVEHVRAWSGPQLRLATGDVFCEWSKEPNRLLWADLEATRLTPQQEAILQRAESPKGTISLCQRCNVGRNKRNRTIEHRIRQIQERTRGADGRYRITHVSGYSREQRGSGMALLSMFGEPLSNVNECVYMPLKMDIVSSTTVDVKAHALQKTQMVSLSEPPVLSLNGEYARVDLPANLGGPRQWCRISPPIRSDLASLFERIERPSQNSCML